MKPLIEVQNVSFAYQASTEHEFLALENINLEIGRGEFLAIVGANGSGKSTLAKHFNALLLPTSGTVVVDGIATSDVSRLWDVRQRVGMVFQNPDNQIVATTVEEDVAFGPENLGLDRETMAVRISDALRAVDMGDKRDQPPHALSGGQKQRVAIAGILAMLPECIVLDEPTAMLDPLGRSEVLNTVRLLNHERGMTVVWITHFMEEVLLADRVVVMGGGRVAMEGPPAEIFRHTDRLRSLDLDVPQLAELVEELQARHGVFEMPVTDVESLVEELWRLSSST